MVRVMSTAPNSDDAVSLGQSLLQERSSRVAEWSKQRQRSTQERLGLPGIRRRPGEAPQKVARQIAWVAGAWCVYIYRRQPSTR